MKPFSFILSSIALFSVQLTAQKLDFSLVYKPNTVYTQTTQQTTEIKFDTAPKQLIDALKEQGIQKPISSKTEIVTKTNDFLEGNKLPFVMTITKTETNLDQGALPKGTTIY